MSRSDPPNRPVRPVTGLEIVCVAVMPMLWYSLFHAILESANFFAWFYGADALATDALKRVPLMPSRQGLWIGAISAPFLVASALVFLTAGVGIPLAEIGVTTRNLSGYVACTLRA